MLILDATQAAALTVTTRDGHMLEPRALADGETWVLPTSVLSDPAHTAIRATLLAMPQRDVALDEFPEVED